MKTTASSFLRTAAARREANHLTMITDDVNSQSSDSLEKEDSSSSSDDEGEPSTTEGTATSDSSTGHEEKELAKHIRRESKDVYMWREIVTGMLLVTAALLTVGTFILLTRHEYDEFAQGFNDTATVVSESVNYQMRTLQETFSGL